MPKSITKAVLTPARKRLIELMQEINYGRIERLEVREGDPVFDPFPTVLRLFLFGKDNGPNTAPSNDSFALKKKAAELFKVFDRERSLFIRQLMVDNGLPVRMTVANRTRS
jgi:hypothetical protein